MKLSTLHVVTWSERQGKFHVDFLDTLLQRNLRYYSGQRDPQHDDWRVLHIAESHAAAHAFLRQLQAAMDGHPLQPPTTPTA